MGDRQFSGLMVAVAVVVSSALLVAQGAPPPQQARPADSVAWDPFDWGSLAPGLFTVCFAPAGVSVSGKTPTCHDVKAADALRPDGSNATKLPALPPGEYALTLTATTADGQVSNPSAALLITYGGVPIPTHPRLATLSDQVAFVTLDTKTQGTWPGVYGAGGVTIATVDVETPIVAVDGAETYTWDAPSTDPRSVVLSPAKEAPRLAACWFTTSTMTLAIDVGPAPRQLALYFLDWDSAGRVERVDVLDATGAVVDTRTVQDFAGGVYAVWRVSGAVTFRVTNTGPLNAVLSAVLVGG